MHRYSELDEIVPFFFLLISAILVADGTASLLGDLLNILRLPPLTGFIRYIQLFFNPAVIDKNKFPIQSTKKAAAHSRHT